MGGQPIPQQRRLLAAEDLPATARRPAFRPVGAGCAVIHLIFNEGYGATRGHRLLRVDLAAEAIRLGRLLVQLAPDDPEALGLLALLALQHARSPARVDAQGDLIPLEEQDAAAGTPP
jgi:predicted RNA polymerase sigma factor